jgi:hypothetical protein
MNAFEVRHGMLATAIVLMLTACRYATPGTEAPSVMPTPSVLDTQIPTPTVVPPPESSPTVLASESPTSTPALSDRERSDTFWDGAVGGHSTYYYESLADIFADSDLVVVGRMTRIHEGETYSEPMPSGYPTPTIKFFYATVSVESVLKGVVESRNPGTVDLRLLGDHQVMSPYMPAHRQLLFLRNGAELMKERGEAPDVQELWRYAYLPLGEGGVVRDIDGTARAQRDLGRCCPDLFPVTLEGRSFEDVVDEVEAESR